MYTREEISKQKQAFWTAFGKYMQPVFKMDADRDRAVGKRLNPPHRIGWVLDHGEVFV